jgi:hypothetical protein
MTKNKESMPQVYFADKDWSLFLKTI